MAIDQYDFDRAITSVASSIEAYTDELESMIVNMRWIATLILAEIAGLSGYRRLLGRQELSLSIAFVVALLGVCLFVLVLGVIKTRHFKRHIRTILPWVIDRCTEILKRDDLSANELRSQVALLQRDQLIEIQELCAIPRKFETVGLYLFGLTSVVAGFLIGLTEFKEFFAKLFLGA